MPTHRKSRPTPRKTSGYRAAAAGMADAVRERWTTAVRALTASEREVEKRVRRLVRDGRIDAKEASALLRDFGTRVQRERRKAMRELESRMSALQTRVQKERRSIARMVDEAVQSALAAFNVPSRQEVSLLTRKVEELSGKIDALRRSRRPRSAHGKQTKAKAQSTQRARRAHRQAA